MGLTTLFTGISMQPKSMIAGYKNRKANRYWWFNKQDIDYVPFPFSIMSRDELHLMDEWYADTDKRGFFGEVNIPAVSLVSGMLLGNNMSNLVQLGHFAGFSTLLFGFVMRAMGRRHSIFTVDISDEMSRYTEAWVRKALLQDYVTVVTSDSSKVALPVNAVEYFDNPIENVFIDSSHQYEHTLKELELWYPAVKEYGFLFLHDVSIQGQQYDSTEEGGVKRALSEWADRKKVSFFSINGNVKEGTDLNTLVYKDGCGLGMVQKARSD